MPKPSRKVLAAAPVAVVEEMAEEVEEVEEAEAPSPVEESPRSLTEVGRQDTPAAGALMNLLTPSPREGKPMDKCAAKAYANTDHILFILRVPLRLIRSEVSEGDGGEGAAADGAAAAEGAGWAEAHRALTCTLRAGLALELPGDADAEGESSP